VNNTKGKLLSTKLPNHFVFEAPPTDFEPLKATDDELLQYGLPHRPDPKKFPKAARLWLRSMGRIKKFVTPDLVALPKIVHGNQGIIQNNTSNIWSGLIVSQPNTAYGTVWGIWTVPSVSVPAGGTGNYFSSLWVGLNGTSLLQAGTEQDASLSPSLFGGSGSNYYAWFEWFPAPSVQVNNFPIAPGQSISVLIDGLSDGSGRGQVAMLNISTGIATSPIVIPIPTTDFNGNPINPPIPFAPSSQAVWILERPSSNDNGVPVPNALADFGLAAIASGGASAVTGSGPKSDQSFEITVGENDQGTLVNMLANDGSTVLSVASEAPELQFNFVGGPTS
jgi:peptidase A4-like protein